MQDNTTYDFENDFLPVKDVYTSFQSFTWSVTPNFSLQLNSKKSFYLLIKPKYNFAMIKATDIVVLYQNAKTIRYEESRKSVSRSFGLNVGLFTKFRSESFDALGVALFVDNINFDKVINSSNNAVNTTYNLGCEITYCFSLKRNKDNF